MNNPQTTMQSYESMAAQTKYGQKLALEQAEARVKNAERHLASAKQEFEWATEALARLTNVARPTTTMPD